jgi:CMP-2-keto-3-deoxyoctulosonic acid synthetase
MSYGESIAVARIAEVGPPGIDTIEDLNAAERHMTAMTEHVQT